MGVWGIQKAPLDSQGPIDCGGRTGGLTPDLGPAPLSASFKTHCPDRNTAPSQGKSGLGVGIRGLIGERGGSGEGVKD